MFKVKFLSIKAIKNNPKKMKKNFLLGGLMLLASSLMAQNTIDNAFFDKVNFRGAFGATDWTSGWANFSPQTTVYRATEKTVVGDITANTIWGSPLRDAASFTDPSLANPFFTSVDYIGAFGSADWTTGWANFNPQTTVYPTATTTVTGDITVNTTWTKNNTYLMDGYIFVQDGVTLTIEAGTVIRGKENTKACLIVSRGGKLIANGTANEPIVFTSNKNVGSRAAGDWAGLVILGKATNNQGNDMLVEGGFLGANARHGGTDDADNSGSLQYVRLEFPGYAFQPLNEINGLTLGSVGSGTTIDYVQVSYSNDDSFEFFGGTVNCKHLIANAGLDDDFDTDNGYRGMVQFAIGLRNPNIDDESAGGKSNGFESDNNGTSPYTGLPETSPTFCNVSLFGPFATPTTDITGANNWGAAMHIRRNSKLKVFNSVFAGYKTGLLIDGSLSQAAATAGDLKVKNCVLSGMTIANFAVTTPWTVTDETTWFNDAAKSNLTVANNSDLFLKNSFSQTTPDFRTYATLEMDGYIFVQDGITLTIKPGTIIRGKDGTKACLIVSRGGKLIANGTVNEPIVFTSNKNVGSRAAGDWAGLVILGKATNNQGNDMLVEGGFLGANARHGGTDDADNSGSIKYVRLEFPGYAFQPLNEINGLTLGSVGSGTSIDNIQVSYSNDDSYEWFGGTVNCKHLIAYAGLDDEFDTDNGYRGMIQYALGLRNPNIDDESAGGKSNGFESDNNGTSPYTGLPETSPLFSNVSLYGPFATPTTDITGANNWGAAMHIRRNSKLQVYNSVFAGYKTGLLIDGSLSQAAATAGDLKVRNCVLSGMTVANFGVTTPWTVTDATNSFNTGTYQNETIVANTDLKITDAFSLTTPNFLPTATSKMLAQSYWYFKPEAGLQYAAPMVFTAFAKGSQVTAAGSMVLVYKNGVCLGSDFVRPTTNDFRLTVGSDLATDTNLEIKLYDAASKKLYNLPTVVDFDSEGSFGTPSNPKRLDATASLNIPLIKNSNWISFNVLPENNSLANVLNYTATDGDFISSQTETSFYYGGVWYGMETSGLSKNQMYVLNCKGTTPGSITVTNQDLVKNNQFSFIAGYNWLGYSLLNSYDINTALAGINASTDDFVITQSNKGGTAWYLTSAWDAYTMNPGTGYIFKSKVASTFSYPTNNLNTAVKVKSANTNVTSSVWTPEAGQRYAMPVLAQVYKNGALYQPEGMQLGVFKNGVCYGSSVLSNNIFNVTVGSDFETLDGLNYKIYDPKTSKFYDVEESVDFASLSPVGKISAPAALRIKGSNNTEEKLNVNPFNVCPTQIETSFSVELNAATASNAIVSLFDMQGRFVKSIFNGEINGNNTITFQRESNLKNGLYLIKATVGENQFTQKVVLK
jgi:hypothetical protein